MGIPASATAAEETVIPADKRLERESDSSTRMNTSIVDFGNRWRWRVGMRSWVRRVESDTGSVSLLSALQGYGNVL
jgi:hypothetical protein